MRKLSKATAQLFSTFIFLAYRVNDNSLAGHSIYIPILTVTNAMYIQLAHSAGKFAD